MGYSAEMNVERSYRDSRINRIFEGTNEINRLLVVEGAIKYAKKGLYDWFGEAQKLAGNLDSITPVAPGDYWDVKFGAVHNFKAANMLVANSFVNAFKAIAHEQEIQNNLANMIMELYIIESMVLRIAKLEKTKGEAYVALYKDMLDVQLNESAHLIRKNGLDALASYAEGDEAGKLMKAIDLLTFVPPVNVKEARRRIADKLIEENKYCF
jgi:alkylation response protein AidB-like acyl-CoA dehydrogenase